MHLKDEMDIFPNETLYPWVLLLKDWQYVVLYNLFENSIAALEIEELKDHKAEVIQRLNEYVLYDKKRLITDGVFSAKLFSLLPYPLKKVPRISRMQLVLPLEEENSLEGIVVPYLCKSALTGMPPISPDEIDVNKIVELSQKLNISSLDISPGKFTEEHLKVIDSIFRSLQNVKITLNILCEDLTNFQKEIENLCAERSFDIRLTIFKNSNFKDISPALKNRISAIIVHRKDLPKGIPTEINHIISPFYTKEDLNSNLQCTSTFSVIDFFTIQEILNENYTPCLYGELAVYPKKELYISGCKHYLREKMWKTSREGMKNSIALWEDSCKECAFRAGCFLPKPLRSEKTCTIRREYFERMKG